METLDQATITGSMPHSPSPQPAPNAPEKRPLASAAADGVEDAELQRRLEETGGQIVYGPVDRSFERAPQSVEAGPLYIDADELHPELAPAENELAGANASTPGLGSEGVDRRDFMRMFSTTAFLGVSAAACVRRPEEKALPYVQQPLDLVPGRANYYASTCGECPVGCRVMVKTREGRPVKLEGDPLDAISQGGLCGVGQSTLQGLYHPERRKQTMMRRGKRLDPVSWDEVYETLATRLKEKRRIAIIAPGSTGNDSVFFREFLDHIGSSANSYYTFEPNSLWSEVTKAHELAFGMKVIPRPDLRRARVFVGIGTDFLETGMSQVFMAKSFAAGHGFNGANGSRGEFIQFESFLSLTGAKADQRFVIPAGAELHAAILLIQHLADKARGKADVTALAEADRITAAHADLLRNGHAALGLTPADFDAVADKLLAADSIILAGSTATMDQNGTQLQLAAIIANQLIGAYGKTLFLDNAWFMPPVEPGDMQRFLSDAGQLDAVFIINSNPVFTLPRSFGFVEALQKVETVVSIQSFPCETDEHADFVLAGHHYLESWGDAQPAAGYWNLRQPTVRPLTDSRQAEDVMLWLAAHLGQPMGYKDYRTYLDKHWKRLHGIFGQETDYSLFISAVLRRGGIGRPETQTARPLQSLAEHIKAGDVSTEFTLSVPLHPHLKDGIGATRPILQETPHSLTTIVWDSYILMSPQKAMAMGIKRNDVVKVTTAAGSLEVPAYPMPGTHPTAVVFYRGNGRAQGISRVSDGAGFDPLALIGTGFDPLSREPVTASIPVSIEKTGKSFRMATVQKGNDIGNRTDIVRTIPVDEAMRNRTRVKDLDNVPDLYPKLDSQDHRWGMTIDLDKCTGCGACLVACSTENNVPQVGREQILLGREMFWIRIDRYFSGPMENPTATFQPMPCQHCNHAPCEAVCPVFATTHDNEGINQMTYNRCVGTRYCANACPYKVRRFNWWTHKWNTIGDRLVDRNPRALNPDVTVRTRGVMEKCSFCYQRIRDAKHRAKANTAGNNNVLVHVACQQTCPSDAITFGDLFITDGEAAKARADNRTYLALGGNPDLKEFGLKTLPNVSYQARVVNGQQAAAHRGGMQGHGQDPHGESHEGHAHP